MKNKEFRSLGNINFDEDNRVIEGVIPYNSKSQDMGFFEILDRGCFAKTLAESKDIRALYEHDDGQLLARTKNGSLRFEDREDGLHFQFDVLKTQLGDDTLTMVRSGLISGCSFGFIAVKDKYDIEEVRHIVEARLLEVSLVGVPAYEETSVSARSLSEAYLEKETLDDNDKQAISEEIDRLTGLLNKGGEAATETVTQSEPEQVAPVVETTEPAEDSKHLEELMDRFVKLEEELNRSFKYGY